MVAVAAAVMVGVITVQKLALAVAYLDPGIDYETVMRSARSWLAGDGFYPADQLTGSWVFHQDEPAFLPPILYPPDALLLFVPFTFLPAFLWWAAPIGVTAWMLVRLRPHPAAWLCIVLLLGLPQSREPIFWGNPVMWAVAAEAAGFAFGWPGVLVLLKPTLAPFALAGAPRRSWVIGLGVLSLVNLPLLPLWFQWVTVLQGSSLSLDYSFSQYPLMAVPLVAWVARDRRRVAAVPAQAGGGAPGRPGRPSPGYGLSATRRTESYRTATQPARNTNESG
jgi:hypothetical protein